MSFKPNLANMNKPTGESVSPHGQIKITLQPKFGEVLEVWTICMNQISDFADSDATTSQ